MKEKMVQSEALRKFTLKNCSCKWSKKILLYCGVVMFIIGIFGLFLYGIPLALPFFGWALIVTPLITIFINFVGKLIRGNVLQYEIADERISKSELIERAVNTDQFTVEVHGDWLDFSVNWRNCFSADAIGSNTSIPAEIYKKLIRLNDNYTYDELDYEACGYVNLSANTFSIKRSMQLGHITHRHMVYDLRDKNSENIAGPTYKFDTAEFSNSVHKWLADNGYRQVDWA